VCEDAPIAEDDDDKWEEHADRDVEQGVLVWQCSVPETLLRFAVERVCRPASVARDVERQTDHPRGGDDGEAGGTAEETPVGGVMADVNVAIDADWTDAKQRHDAAADTEAGKQRAQPLTTIVKQRWTNNRTCHIHVHNVYCMLAACSAG